MSITLYLRLRSVGLLCLSLLIPVLLAANPCGMVEFPVTLKGLFRPHYVTWSEQQTIENNAVPHLRNAIRIIAETGLRVKKELLPMKKGQIDFLNGVLWIPDSKTPNGVAEIPLTKLALEAFQNQLAISGNREFLFPSDLNQAGHLRSLRTAWRKALKEPEFHISDCTICDPLMPHGSAPEA